MMNCYALSPGQDRQSSAGMFPVTGSSLLGVEVSERAEVSRKVKGPLHGARPMHPESTGLGGDRGPGRPLTS